MASIRRVLFRVDASLRMGSGHVMRCLTLANHLQKKDIECVFVSREHPGNLIELIEKSGFRVKKIPFNQNEFQLKNPDLIHAEWLGAYWHEDVSQTISCIGSERYDWIIVDHYAIDAKWELVVREHVGGIMVIDDIADRNHICDILLDQNMVYKMSERYCGKVSKQTIQLLGPKYALIREEFINLRRASLLRRHSEELNNLLIFLGGGNPEDDILNVVRGLKLSEKIWPSINLVIGSGFIAKDILRNELAGIPNVNLHVQTPNMARLMHEADFAITAAGSVTWEKCCLGLPSAVVIQDYNQLAIANKMSDLGAVYLLGSSSLVTFVEYAAFLNNIPKESLKKMTACSQSICDGSGVNLVSQALGLEYE